MRTYLAWMSSFLCLAAITGFAKSPVESCETRSLSELLTKTNILSTTPKLVLKADKCNGETCTFYYSFENDNVLQVEILKGDSATICEGQLKEHEPPAV